VEAHTFEDKHRRHRGNVQTGEFLAKYLNRQQVASEPVRTSPRKVAQALLHLAGVLVDTVIYIIIY
jgi:hypothetical protein